MPSTCGSFRIPCREAEIPSRSPTGFSNTARTRHTAFWDREFLKGLLHGKASIWEFERYGSFEVGEEPRPILVTPEKEFPFLDAVHKGYWEKFGLAVCRANGIEPDLAVRGTPPFKTRLVEGLKAFLFAIFPASLIVRVQNALASGAKERR